MYHFFKQTLTGNTVKSRYVDDKLGWRATENYRFYGYKTDASGRQYLVEKHTDEHGFQQFGDVNSNSNKLLVIGDSFTQANHVSDDKSYYGFLQNNLPIEVFAYGAGGYGTLQEYMILDEYVDLIKPDAILLQFCSNDFINNSYKLESNSYINNNRMRRPYLDGTGKIVYMLPKQWSFVRSVANKYSRILYWLIHRIDQLFSRRAETVERHISGMGKNHSAFKEAAETTAVLMRMFKNRAGERRKVFGFSVDDEFPYYEELKRISGETGIEFIDGIPEAVREAEERGIVTRAVDKAHWNEVGHRIAGEVLVEYFRREWDL